MANPYYVYTTEELLSILNKRDFKTQKYIITMTLTRLHRSGFIQRTPTQLRDGHRYSQRNTAELDRIYHNYLLPYNFSNKEKLLAKIKCDDFEKLSTVYSFNIKDLANFKSKKQKSPTFMFGDVLSKATTLLGRQKDRCLSVRMQVNTNWDFAIFDVRKS